MPEQHAVACELHKQLALHAQVRLLRQPGPPGEALPIALVPRQHVPCGQLWWYEQLRVYAVPEHYAVTSRLHQQLAVLLPTAHRAPREWRVCLSCWVHGHRPIGQRPLVLHVQVPERAIRHGYVRPYTQLRLRAVSHQPVPGQQLPDWCVWRYLGLLVRGMPAP